MWAPPTIVYVHGKNVQTKRKSTHICAQSFIFFPPFPITAPAFWRKEQEVQQEN